MGDSFDKLCEALAEFGWSAGAVKQVLDGGIQCIYCGKPMLQSFDDFRLWENDHILPKSKYPELAGDPEKKNEEEEEATRRNLVGACRVCNLLKSSWDPNNIEGEPEIYTKGGDFTDDMRRELIRRSRVYIHKLRTRKMAELNDTRRAFEAYWAEHPRVCDCQ